MDIVKLEICIDNAAFHDNGSQHHEVARILRDLAQKIDNYPMVDDAILHDINGNKVGEYQTVYER